MRLPRAVACEERSVFIVTACLAAQCFSQAVVREARAVFNRCGCPEVIMALLLRLAELLRVGFIFSQSERVL